MLQFQITFLCLLALGRSAVIQDEKAGLGEDGLKAALKAIEERLDRWDAFYMGRLEPRMIGAATSLANLDTNIRNLQERAHVWDTFQLHVAAWNDQIKSLHSKINIINEGIEKVLAPDSRFISTVYSLDEKFKSLENKLQLEWKQSNEALTPIVSDFALKKLLHLVQKIDRKLDRGSNLQNNAEVFEKSSCNSQNGFNDLLREVSNKIDIVFGEDEQPSRACRRLSDDLRKLVEEGQQSNAPIRHASYRRQDFGQLLRDVELGYKKLLKHQEKNFEESEDILKDIEKRLDDIEDDDDLEELIVKKFKQVERQLRGIRAEIDDDDDDDDSDEDNDTREKKSKRKHRDDTDEDDDSDDDDSDDDNDTKEKRHRKKHDDDSDDDDSDDDDTKERRHRKKDDDDSDDDDSDDDTRERRQKRKDDDSDDDSDDDDTREKRHRKKDDDDSDDDDSDDDTRDRRHKKKDDDDSDDDDTRERRSEKKHDDTDEDDDDKSKQKHDNDTDEDDDRNGTRHV